MRVFFLIFCMNQDGGRSEPFLATHHVPTHTSAWNTLVGCDSQLYILHRHQDGGRSGPFPATHHVPTHTGAWNTLVGCDSQLYILQPRYTGIYTNFIKLCFMSYS